MTARNHGLLQQNVCKQDISLVV